MGSQLLSILRQGVWASLTGGWYYDQKQSHFSNLFHLYIWLLLLCLPLVIELCIKSYINHQDHSILWSLYCLVIASIFSVIKFINAYLHHLFDSGESIIEEEPDLPIDNNGDKCNEKLDKEGDKSSICYQSFDENSRAIYSTGDIHLEKRANENSFEMMVLKAVHSDNSIKEEKEDATFPGNNSFNSTRSGHVHHVDVYNKGGHFSGHSPPQTSGVIDLEVDFHHRNSSGSSIANWGSASSASGVSDRISVAEGTEQFNYSQSKKDNAASSPSSTNSKITKGKTKKDELKEEGNKCDDNEKKFSEKVLQNEKNDELNENEQNPELALANTRTSALSLSNNASSEAITITQSAASSVTMLKGASLSELGFMAQDPSVLRNISGAVGNNESQLRTFKPSGSGRSESVFSGRRARSELETARDGEKKAAQGATTSIPPSHPVSLEVIGSTCQTSDDIQANMDPSALLQSSGAKSCRFSSVDLNLNHPYQPHNHRQGGSLALGKTKSASVISDSIKPIHELSSDEITSLPRDEDERAYQQKDQQQHHSHLHSQQKQKFPESSQSKEDLVQKKEGNQRADSIESNSKSLQTETGHRSDIYPIKDRGRKVIGRLVVKQSSSRSTPKRLETVPAKNLIKPVKRQNSSHIKENAACEISLNNDYSSTSSCSSDDDESSWMSKSPSSSLSSSQSDSLSDNERTPLTSCDHKIEIKSHLDRAFSNVKELPNQVPFGSTVNESPSNTSKSCEHYVHASSISKRDQRHPNKTSSKDANEFLGRPKISRRRSSGKSVSRMNSDIDSRSHHGNESGNSVIVYQPLGGGGIEPPSPSTSQHLGPSSSTSIKSADGPPAYLLARILATPGTHLAKSHDDTSMGAVHCFQDERGNWLTYIFDENSIGTARGLINSESKAYLEANFASEQLSHQNITDKWPSGSSESSDSVAVMENTHSIGSCPSGNTIHNPHQRLAVQDKCSTKNTFSSQNETQFIRSPSINSMLADPNSISFPIPINSRFGANPNIVIAPDRHVSFSTNMNSPEYANIAFRLPMRYNDFTSPEPTPPKPKQYYKLWIPFCSRWRYIKIRFDRLNLLTLLDRSLTKFELFSSIILAVLVAALGSLIIEKGFFSDLWLFLFCFVMCSSQYTLLKSVQPDAASPAHGYNRIIIYSRPIYFSIVCLIILLTHYYLSHNLSYSFTLYGFNFLDPSVVRTVKEGAKIFVLSFPIIFSFGLLPQINTFLMYLLEQIDIHVFGGTAFTIGLTSAFYCIIRSILVVLFLYALALTSLLRVTHRKSHSTPLTYHDYDVLFSVFCGFLVFFAYFLSRQSSDPTIVYNMIRKYFVCDKMTSSRQKRRRQTNGGGREAAAVDDDVNSNNRRNQGDEDDLDSAEKEYIDPLPEKLESTLVSRYENDIILSVIITIVFFAIHVSTIFTLQPYVQMSLGILAVSWGVLLHYLFTHFRKELPWQFFASPILKPKEYDQYEVKGEAQLMWFEKLQCWLSFIEKNAIYPCVFLSALTSDTPEIIDKYGIYVGTLIMVICAFKSIRCTFNDSSHNHFIILFTWLLFHYDLSYLREPFLINYAVFSTIYLKFTELLLKIRFVVTYVAPWQISWGSAFHAFAQPFSVPHSGMLFVQAILSSILSSPLEPVLGSAIFLCSYVRPVKFWERDYNTKRIDYSNTRLVNQLERSIIGSDDNNLNSIFYEHLTRSLQNSLYGDLALGRWGQVSQGDCFVLASDNLNCLVHIIELGNGLVTFQVRGLEFRGTYCQQREVEAISESVNDDEGCCCCEPGHLPSMLSVNAAFNQRWLAWEVTHSKYVLEGYSISDNSALSMLQPFELRKALITYYVKSIIYYTLTSSKLETWLRNEEIRETIDNITRDRDIVDLDPIFNLSIDEDYDFRASGITRASFCYIYLSWIKYCLGKRKHTIDDPQDREAVVTLCFALSLLARRALSTASHNSSFNTVEFLLFGLHSLFKGDFRITSPRDEWVFKDIDLLKKVIAPSVRMAVKLHQDHFMSTDEYDDNDVLWASITNYRKNWVISHEADPVWRNALLSNVPSLLALRHVYEDGTNQYKIIMLNIRHLSFRVIKVNRECVRGLWAGQQQELVYLRNRNNERGSIQNAKQALRNIINSSCDQPIGYPIYVSPLITSFGETNPQYCSIIGRPLSFKKFKSAILSTWNRLKNRCREGCSSGRPCQEEISSDEMMMRTLNPVAPCRIQRIQERYSFERNREGRRSHSSRSSDRSFNEFEGAHLLSRISRTIPNQLYPQTASAHNHSTGSSAILETISKTTASGRRQNSSTLVNISAFRPQDSCDNLEMTSFSSSRPPCCNNSNVGSNGGGGSANNNPSYDQQQPQGTPSAQPIYQNVTLSSATGSSSSTVTAVTASPPSAAAASSTHLHHRSRPELV